LYTLICIHFRSRKHFNKKAYIGFVLNLSCNDANYNALKRICKKTSKVVFLSKSTETFSVVSSVDTELYKKKTMNTTSSPPPTIRKNSENSKNLVFFLSQLGAQQLELGILHWFLLFWQIKQEGFKKGV
jgi:hypothetical protein